MKFYIIFGISLLLGSLTGADPSCKSSPCIGVDVYYEALCGDSINFITNKLAPQYSALKDYLDVNFVPYGKATHMRNEKNEWVFTCQHGNSECKGNKAQACAFEVIKETSASEKKQEDSVKLVDCVMKSSYPASSVPRCADTVGLSKSAQQKIIHCAQSSTGDDLLAAHGDKTHSLQPPLRFVPTIVVNGVYSEPHQNAALQNFKGLVCDLLKEGGNDLPACA